MSKNQEFEQVPSQWKTKNPLFQTISTERADQIGRTFASRLWRSARDGNKYAITLIEDEAHKGLS